jgi:hypothetical protein
MVVASYKSNGATYSLVQATMSNVTADMVFALQDMSVYTDEDEYRARMEESVRQGLAFRITKSGKKIGVMYNLFENGEYQGAAIYCKGDRVGMMVLMKSMFEVYDWHKILIAPHCTDDVKYYVSMATADSIRSYHSRGTPLVIVKKDIVQRGPELFKYLGIEVL